jgi:hypothetical protein
MASANDNNRAATAKQMTVAADHVLDQIVRCRNAAKAEVERAVDELKTALARLQNMRLARRHDDAETLRARAIVDASSFLQVRGMS